MIFVHFGLFNVKTVQLEKKRKGKRGAKSAQTKSQNDSSVMDMTSVHDNASSVGGQQSVAELEEYHFNQIQYNFTMVAVTVLLEQAMYSKAKPNATIGFPLGTLYKGNQ